MVGHLARRFGPGSQAGQLKGVARPDSAFGRDPGGGSAVGGQRAVRDNPGLGRVGPDPPAWLRPAQSFRPSRAARMRRYRRACALLGIPRRNRHRRLKQQVIFVCCRSGRPRRNRHRRHRRHQRQQLRCGPFYSIASSRSFDLPCFKDTQGFYCGIFSLFLKICVHLYIFLTIF